MEHSPVGISITIVESGNVVFLLWQRFRESLGRFPGGGLFSGTNFGRSGWGWDLDERVSERSQELSFQPRPDAAKRK
jgi:hypothetical protein